MRGVHACVCACMRVCVWCVCVCVCVEVACCCVCVSLLSLKGCFLCSWNLALLRMSNNGTDGPNLLPPNLSGETSRPVPPAHTCLPEHPRRPLLQPASVSSPRPPSQEPSHSDLEAQAAPTWRGCPYPGGDALTLGGCPCPGAQTSPLWAPTELGKPSGLPNLQPPPRVQSCPAWRETCLAGFAQSNRALTESKTEMLFH